MFFLEQSLITPSFVSQRALSIELDTVENDECRSTDSALACVFPFLGCSFESWVFFVSGSARGSFSSEHVRIPKPSRYRP